MELTCRDSYQELHKEPGSSTDSVDMAGTISIYHQPHIGSHGITAPESLQEGDEGWGRRAMHGYRGVEKSEP